MIRTLKTPAFGCVAVLACLAFSTVACSSEDGNGSPNQAPPGDEHWTMLAEKSWSLNPGQEYPDLCAKVQLTRDIYVSKIRPVHPKGTHHTFVALSDTGDGERCTTAVATGTMIYAAGVGSEGLNLPEGVGLKLAAGKWINLSLHLYNATTEALQGTSGLEIIEMDAADVEHESSILLAGPLGFDIPPGRAVIQHDCVIADETTTFALFPHMHQLGRHLKTTVTIGGETRVIHDAEYDFEEQRQIPIEPLYFKAGDKVSTECTFENPTGKSVAFGESSDTEMCFSAMFRYPSTASAFCVGGGQ